MDVSSGEASVDKFGKSVNKMAREVAQAADKAGESVGKIGDKIDFSAEKINRQERSIVDSIKRTTAQYEQLGKTASQKIEFKINEKGLDPTKFEPMLLKLREVEAQAARTAAAASSSFDKMGAASFSAADAWARMTVVGLGIGAIAGTVGAVTKSLFDASVAAERLKIGLDFASGGNGAREMAYVTDLSNKLGLSLQSTASSYMSFAAASRGTALEGAASKAVFESVAKAAAVMGLSTEQTGGTLLALQQMMSKGTVQAEELRGQLGERLPGAFQIAARAMGVTTQELGKMLETGKVLADDFLPKFAAQLESEIGGGAEKAAVRLGAATNRMETALFRLKVALGDTGIAEWFASGLNRSTSIFNFIASDVEKLNSQGGLRKAAADVNELNIRQTNLKNGIAAGFYGQGFQPELAAVSAKLEIAKQKFRELDAASKTILSGAGGGRGFVNPATTTQLYAKDAAAKAERDAYYAQDIRQTKEQIRTEEIGKARKANALLIAKAEGDTNEVLKLQKTLSIEIANINERYKDKKVGGGAGSATAGQSELASIRARVIETQRYIDTLKTQGLEAAKQTEGEKLAAKYREELTGGLKGAARANKELALAQAEKLAGLQKEQAGIEGLLKAQKDFETARDREAVSRQSVILKIEESAQSLEDEVAMYGKGKEAIEALSIARLEEKKAILLQFDGSDQRIQQIEDEIAARKRLAAAGDSMAALKMGTHTDQLLANAKEQASLYQDELRLAGLTSLERAKIVAQRQVEIKYAKELEKLNQSNLPEADKVVQRQKIAQAQQIEGSAAVARVVQDDWAKTADQINQSLTDALMRGFESGKSFAMNLRDTLTNMFRTMVLRPIISATLAPVGGVLAGVANAATGGSGGGLMGGLSNLSTLSTLGSAIGTGIAGTVGSTIGTIFGATAGNTALGMAAGLGTGSSLAAASAASVAGGGAAAGAGLTGAATAMAAVPVAGWVALAAVAAYALFAGNKDPASESTGDTTAKYDATGKRIGSHAGFGFENAQTSAAADALRLSYAATAKALGIGTVESSFGTGGNSDGKTRHFAVGSSAGGSSYHSADNMEYSDAAYSLEASRAVFAALQGSDLPKYLAGAFDGIAAGSATQEQITAAINGAQALKQFHEQLQALPFDNLKDMSYGATKAMIEASGSLEALGSNVAAYYEKFSSAGERAAQGTANITAQFEKLGIALPETHAAFRALVEAQDLNTTAGQNMAAALFALAPAFDSAASAAQAAAQRMSSVIADYATAGEVRSFQVEQIRQGLANGGVNLSNDQIANANRQDARALWEQFDAQARAGDTSARGRADAVLDQAAAFAKITENTYAAQAAGNNSGGGGGGGGSVTDPWKSAADAIVNAIKDLQSSLLETGPDSFARLQAQFAIDTARAKAGDIEAAQGLPALAKSVATAAKDYGQTSVEQAVLIGGLIESMADVVKSRGFSVPGFAVGTNYVPQDMLAVVHQGEAIIPRAYNPANGGGGNNAELVSEIRALREEVASLRYSADATASATQKTARTLDNAANGGQPLTTLAVS